MLILGPLMSTMLQRLASCAIFPIFLENKSRSEQNEYVTFIKSSCCISEQKIREINFSSMCHIFVISRGLPGHSLLILLRRTMLIEKRRKSVKSVFKKKFQKNEIVSCVEAWIALIDQQHLVHKAFKLCATFAQDSKLVFIQMT